MERLASTRCLRRVREAASGGLAAEMAEALAGR